MHVRGQKNPVHLVGGALHQPQLCLWKASLLVFIKRRDRAACCRLYTWDDYGVISAISNSRYRSILCRLAVKGRGFRAEPQNSIPWKALSEMCGGRQCCTLLRAEAGGGKSRPVDEFADRRSGRALILKGGCIEQLESALPYAPITALLHELVCLLELFRNRRRYQDLSEAALIEQKRHADRIDEPAIDARRTPDDAFAGKSHLFVESDSTGVVFVNIEFNPGETAFPCGSQCRLDEPSSQTSAPIGGKDPHSEVSAMGVRREKMPADVAPTDDLVLRDGNELRIALRNHARHELTRLRQGSCFQHGQVFFLPRDHVERMMKAVDMGGSDRLDPDA